MTHRSLEAQAIAARIDSLNVAIKALTDVSAVFTRHGEDCQDGDLMHCAGYASTARVKAERIVERWTADLANLDALEEAEYGDWVAQA
jgi:hypothetical protein